MNVSLVNSLEFFRVRVSQEASRRATHCALGPMAGSRPLHLSIGKLVALGACLETVPSPFSVYAILKLLKGRRFFLDMLHFFFNILDFLLYWLLLARDQGSIFRFTWDRHSGTTFSYLDSVAMVKRKLNLGAIVLLVRILNRLGGIIYV